MPKLCLRILFALCVLCLAAPQSSLSASMAANAPASAQEQQAAPQDQSEKDKAKDDKDKEKDKKDKDKDKKKDKKKKSQDDLNTDAVFSPQVVSDVLGMIRDGLEGHSQRLLLSAFDGDKMDGYLSFEDQIQSMFDRYDAFRVHYTILQQTVENGKGVVLAMFELEETPRNGGPLQRKNSQVRFELERGRKGWRVVDYNPRGFFS